LLDFHAKSKHSFEIAEHAIGGLLEIFNQGYSVGVELVNGKNQSVHHGRFVEILSLVELFIFLVWDLAAEKLENGLICFFLADYFDIRLFPA
jgi:hypothetical protein